jgi:hypothetical protein
LQSGIPTEKDTCDVKVIGEMWTSFAILLKLHHFAKQMYVASYTRYLHTTNAWLCAYSQGGNVLQHVIEVANHDFEVIEFSKLVTCLLSKSSIKMKLQ